MSSKLDVSQRLTIPGNLADFLDKLQAEWGMDSRRKVILRVIRNAKRAYHHAAVNRRYRARRRKAAAGNHGAGPP